MTYKSILSFTLLFCTSVAFGQTAVPVEDTTTHDKIDSMKKKLKETINDSSTQISTQVLNTGKMITAILSEINRQDALRLGKEYMAKSSKENAQRFNVNFGAKTKDGCAMLESSKNMQMTQVAQQKIATSLAKTTDVYIQRGRYRAANEPGSQSDAASILTRYREIDSMRAAKAAKEVGSMVDPTMVYDAVSDGNKNTEAGLKWKEFEARLNPFADVVPENFDDPNQPAAALVKSAHVKWKNEMMRSVAENAAVIHSKKVALSSDTWAEYLFPDNASGSAMKALSMGATGKQSYYTTLEALNKARLYNPDWFAYTNVGAGEKALLADNNQMQAVMMANQQEIIRLLVIIAETTQASMMNDMRYYWRKDTTPELN